MREILFRGNTYTDKWVYGYLLKGSIDNDFYILENVGATPFWINPETVGQYTGLTDKNGKKIFEGDIVKDLGGYMDGIPRVVVWEEETMEFETYLVKNHWAYGTNRVCLWCIKDRELEVIGNIHDNKELLGE